MTHHDCRLAAPLTPGPWSLRRRAGGSPGRLAVISRDPATSQWAVTAEYPGNLPGAEDTKFNPHGFDRNGPAGTTLVTADYVEASSTWADKFGRVAPT
jgi:hypothetical protein